MSGGHFGPGVIGEEQFAKEQLVIERYEDRFGPGVLDPAPTAAPAPSPASEGVKPVVTTAATPAGGETDTGPAYLTLSVNELKVELDANPDAFDTLMTKEFLRPEGPRKGALREFLSNERAHATPRAEVLEALEHALSRDAG